ncbi:ABC transporter permease [Streptomyces sp. SID3343]|uniref:ABC transporter permease n=1 Tax=Streptomyces sp. SID3343 TaxID=2690260 RepID=UPI001368D70B|nr:ABC transporter permease [Streptomyces sp. SID3343]MYV97965.1 ABC transporter permease [Streptomyces sp. SID3343]
MSTVTTVETAKIQPIFRAAARAEWTKIRSVPSTRWLPWATVVLIAGVSALVCAFVAKGQRREDGAEYDAFTLVHYGVNFGQMALVAFAVLAVAGEYGSGTIRSSLAAVPDRRVFAAAKLTVITAIGSVTGIVSSLSCTLLARLVMPAGDIALGSSDTWRTAFGHAAYLTLLTVLCAGAAFLLRTPMASMGLLMPLLFLGTAALTAIPGVREVGRFLPDKAGQRIMRLRDFNAHEVDPWIGIGVMALWAVAAVVATMTVIRRRDA